MPRRPRLLVEGGIYHVYNRFTNGEPVFSDVDSCERFLDIVREVKARDCLTVFAWCLMTSHYHLAVRTGAVPLSRSMRQIEDPRTWYLYEGPDSRTTHSPSVEKMNTSRFSCCHWSD
jgi:REP element-mobilizing transposase RayT